MHYYQCNNTTDPICSTYPELHQYGNTYPTSGLTYHPNTTPWTLHPPPPQKKARPFESAQTSKLVKAVWVKSLFLRLALFHFHSGSCLDKKNIGNSWALLYCGTVVLWYCGIVVQWYCGTVVQWYSGTVVQWYSGTVVQWYSGTVVLWYCGTVVLWFCGTA